ncbi:MAG TPA: long-chain fatty acid--CoA ligase [Spirochaetota bacterium]|nr:long-chain fatty acid--CoA ligase [Spirochaetota bacterium]
MEKPWLKWYDKGVSASIDYPEIPLRDMFNRNAENNPDRPYLIFGDREISYSEANLSARKLANAITALGIKKGDRVALMSPNFPEYVIALEACYKLGVVVVPTNPMATVREITHQFSDSGAVAVIAWAGIAAKPVEVLNEKMAALKKVIVFGDKEDGTFPFSDDILKYEDILKAAPDTEPDVAVSSEDLAMLQYTGGTTGVSKGCMLSNRNILSQAHQDHEWFKGSYASEAYLKTLCCMPLYHIYGFNTNININKVAGGCSIIVTEPTVDNILNAINQHEPNYYSAVPAMIFGLNQHPATPESKIKSIKGMICGSSPLAVEVMKKFEELSGAKITEGYGLSETSNVLTCTPFGKRKPGSVGLAWPDIDIRIVDIDTGTKDMPVGEPGELIARGPNIMSGYWKNEDETANALRDGWLYTGDLAYMDEDGFFFIVDRKKDMILSSGFNVYPREIDEVIYELPQVFKTCAIGVPDPKRGESVKAFIVLNPGAALTEEQVLKHCKEKLSAYKVPKFVEFIDELPLTAVGKPMRNELRNRENAKN